MREEYLDCKFTSKWEEKRPSINHQIDFSEAIGPLNSRHPSVKQPLCASSVLSDPFADRLSAPGITAAATAFDKNGQVTEITNSLGVRWQRLPHGDGGSSEWAIQNLPTVHGNFVGRVKVDADGSLEVDTNNEHLISRRDGSYVHSYKGGAVETWNPVSNVSTSFQPDGEQTKVHYDRRDWTKLEPTWVEKSKLRGGAQHVVEKYKIDRFGYYHNVPLNSRLNEGVEQSYHFDGRFKFLNFLNFEAANRSSF